MEQNYIITDRKNNYWKFTNGESGKYWSIELRLEQRDGCICIQLTIIFAQLQQLILLCKSKHDIAHLLVGGDLKNLKDATKSDWVVWFGKKEQYVDHDNWKAIYKQLGTLPLWDTIRASGFQELI